MRCTGFFLVILFGYATHSKEIDCPALCTCKDKPFQGLVTNCSFLGELYISQHLAQIPSRTKFLYLKGNNITTLTEKGLNHIYILHFLHLEGNAISSIESVLRGMKESQKRHLYTIDLTSNKIESISSNALPRSTQLQSLLLGNNGITSLEPGNFRHLHQLITLDLSYNDLTHIPRDAFLRLDNLEYLKLCGNGIAHIGNGAFRNLRRLRQLNLSENSLANGLREETFQGLDQLQILELAGNNISVLNANVFSALVGLLQINLDLNCLPIIPVRALRVLIGLQYLFLNHNNIRQVPKELNLLSNLTALYLTSNSIRMVNKHAIMGLINLHSLWLNHNHLRSLPSQLQQRFQQMSADQIRLEGNPFLCDCQLLWLGRWLRGQHEPYYLQNVPTCDAPESKQGFPVSQIPVEKMTCEYEPIACTENGRLTTECALIRLTLCDHSRSDLMTSCLCSSEPVSHSCKVCPEGSFGTDSCTKCPAFSVSQVASRHISECLCQAGYTGSPAAGEPCTACLRGTYKRSRGFQKCLPCPTGSVSSDDGSSVCLCIPGYTLDLHRDRCKACPENTYKAEYGTGPCIRCTLYSRSPSRSTGPEACQCIHGPLEGDLSRCRKFIDHESADVMPAPSHYQTQGYIIPSRSSPYTAQIISVVLVAVVLLVSTIVIIYLRRIHQSRHVSQREHYVSPKSDLTKIRRIPGESVKNELYHDHEFPVERLQMGALLGQGAFGQVHLAVTRVSKGGYEQPQEVAVKSLTANSTPECHEALRKELDQMISVGQHPNIICLLGAANTKAGELMIVMEYAPYGNLLDYLRKNSKVLIEEDDGVIKDYKISDIKNVMNMLENKTYVRFALQVSRGMEHLAKMKCVHRDLAARNVLLSEDFVAKISDFGLAREVYESGYYFKNSKGRLPFRWMSPEALLSGQYTTKSDVWSYGVLLWEMATGGGTPYPGIAAEQMCDMLIAGYRMRQPPNCPIKLYGMMLHCWHETPAERPSFRILVDRWERILKEVPSKDEMSTDRTNESVSQLTGFTTMSSSGTGAAEPSVSDCTSIEGNTRPTSHHKRAKHVKLGLLHEKVDEWLSTQPLMTTEGLKEDHIELCDFLK